MMKEKEKKLEVVVSDSLGDNLANFGTGILEVGLDSVLDEGLLQDVPVIGTIVNFIKTGVSVKERLYVKKILKFFYEFNKIDEEKRKKFIKIHLTDESKKEKFGETILTLIEKSDDTDKFKLYAKIFEKLFSNHVSFDEALRLCHMIEKSYLTDLKYIHDFKDDSLENQHISGELYKVGFLSISGFDAGEINNPNSGGIFYKMNHYGKILKELID